MNKWLTVIVVLVVIYVIGSLVAIFAFSSDNSLTGKDKIVVIPVRGVITAYGNGGFFDDDSVSSTELVKKLDKLNKDNSVKGIIFEINSPGGGAVASEEIASAVNKLNKTNYAVIREVGASGAYWVASATDKIFVNPMSVTGSIGVFGSYLEFSELMSRYGVDYQRLVSGERKDIGIPYRNLTLEEEELLQSKLDVIHEFFISDIAENRNMSFDVVSELATGEFYLGQEALDLGLVDEIGGKQDAIELMKEELNITDISIVEKKEQKGLFDILGKNFAYYFGQGFASKMVEHNLVSSFEIRT